MKSTRIWLRPVLFIAVALLVGTVYIGYRLLRVVRVGTQMEAQIRYLIENGGTIGEVPAEQAFSIDFLETIFGDNPQLVAKLKAVVHQGLSDEPTLNLGEVAAMLVTYSMDDKGNVSDVVVHAIGGFPLSRKKPGFNRNGYFFSQVDPNLWNFGNILIGFLGRDMVLFSESDEITIRQQNLIDAVFQGNILALAERLDPPMYFSMVLPEPKRIVPPQLRGHVQAVIVKGQMGREKGHIETLILTPAAQAATYAQSMCGDMKMAAEYTVKTRWGGQERETLWGPVRDPWWAYEMAQTLERTELDAKQNVVRIQADFERVMINAILKTFERMGRDLAMMQAVMSEGDDPRVADARLKTRKPLHYWSEEHQWGPDWPIGASTSTNAADSSPPQGPTADSAAVGTESTL